jgi:hypothetical protein
MPGTNDVNEGALGKVVRINRWNKPTQTKHQNVAQAKFSYNNTQQFMDNEFIAEDHTFIIQEARRQDESHLEQQRLTEIWEHDERVVAARRQKDLDKQEKAAEYAAKVAAAILSKIMMNSGNSHATD